MSHSNRGFTFVEMVVVMGILATITGLAVISLSGIQRRTYIQTSITEVVSELKSQQLKAMQGNTQGSGGQDAFGIYFQSDGYTLFKGTTYSAANPTNFKIKLTDTIQFSSITFPSSQIIFESGTGEFTNYASGSDTITIRNTTNSEQKTITINKYGAITQIN